jgi:hypothetical protein
VDIEGAEDAEVGVEGSTLGAMACGAGWVAFLLSLLVHPNAAVSPTARMVKLKRFKQYSLAKAQTPRKRSSYL